MVKERLFDVERKQRSSASKELVHIANACPECGAQLASFSTAQPALFRHAGYGAVLTIIWDWCLTCLWSVERSVTETNPRRLR